MPQMGVSVAEGTIVEWRKRVGDWVERDEAIVEISTDKVETEVPSPAAGRVAAILVEVGETVDVGTVLAHDRRSSALRRGPRGAAPSRERAHAPAPSRPSCAGSRPSTASTSTCADPGHRPPRAGDQEGRARVHRVGASRRPRSRRCTPSRRTRTARARTAAEASTGEPLSLMRKQIGEHMVRSLQTAAHCTTVVEADMSRVEARAGQLGSRTCRSSPGRRSRRCASTRRSTRRSRATGSRCTTRCTSASRWRSATTG